MLVDQCHSFMHQFSLQYGAFDFILDQIEYSEPVFLECNPAGEFSFLDDLLDNRPSSLLGKLLVEFALDQR